MSLRKSGPIIPALLGLGITITLLFAAINLQVIAQGDPTPTPSIEEWYLQDTIDWNLPYSEPGTSEGDAVWTIEDMTFESQYPFGFTFSILPRSSRGEIVLASVIWSHTPHELQRMEVRNIPRSGVITAEWGATESLPPWVVVNYYWSLVDSAGNRYRSDWLVGNEYIDETSEWTRTESDDVVIFLQEGLDQDVVHLSLQAMDTQRETFLQAWGGLLPYKPRVILFANQRDFQAWRRGFGGEGVIGQTSEEWGATVQVINDNDPIDLAYGTVLHEIAHLYQFQFAPDAFPGGSWFTEGNATLFELHQQYDYENRVRLLATHDQLPLLLQGGGPLSFAAGPDGSGRYGYDVGYTFWKWIVVNYGLDTHRQIITGLAAGTPRNAVLEQVLGMTTDEMESGWAQWLGADSPAPTLVPTWTLPPFPPTMTPYPFGN